MSGSQVAIDHIFPVIFIALKLLSAESIVEYFPAAIVILVCCNYSKMYLLFFFDKGKRRAIKGNPIRKTSGHNRYECIKCGVKCLSKSGFYRHGLKCMIDIST